MAAENANPQTTTFTYLPAILHDNYRENLHSGYHESVEKFIILAANVKSWIIIIYYLFLSTEFIF